MRMEVDSYKDSDGCTKDPVMWVWEMTQKLESWYQTTSNNWGSNGNLATVIWSTEAKAEVSLLPVFRVREKITTWGMLSKNVFNLTKVFMHKIESRTGSKYSGFKLVPKAPALSHMQIMCMFRRKKVTCRMNLSDWCQLCLIWMWYLLYMNTFWSVNDLWLVETQLSITCILH